MLFSNTKWNSCVLYRRFLVWYLTILSQLSAAEKDTYLRDGSKFYSKMHINDLISHIINNYHYYHYL